MFGFGLFGNAVADIDRGLVAHYNFDGNANDSSGNGKHGTENGGVSYVTGQFGQAVSFDGGDDYLEIPDTNLLDLSNSLTLSAWIYTTSHEANTKGIISKGRSSNGTGYRLGVYNGKADLGLNNNLYNCFVHSKEPINTNKWVHIAGSWDGTIMKIYVNGSLNNTNDSCAGSSLTDSSESLNIGRETSGLTGRYFRGRTDEARIYNRALTESEINEVYQYGNSCTSSEAGTVLSNLDIHMPSLDYQTLLGTQNIWVDFEYYGEGSNGELLWKLKDYGAN